MAERGRPAGDVEAAIERAARARHLALLLDYDGTLVPFAPSPDLAAPDGALLDLVRRLAARPRTEVHLVSGRTRESLERFAGALPVGLHAEHGLWSRRPGEGWVLAAHPDVSWREPALAVLRDLAARTPGALVEVKTAGLAWHHRAADPALGAARAEELALRLAALLSGAPAEILHGDSVIEVRPEGITKGRIAAQVLGPAPPGTLALAMGDDRTDEDLFAALPEDAISVHVGPSPSRARVRLVDVAAARELLGRIAAAP